MHAETYAIPIIVLRTIVLGETHTNTHGVFQSHNVVLPVRVNDAVWANRHSVCLAVVREPGEVNGASGGRHGRLVGRNCPVSSQRVGCCVDLCAADNH